MHPSSEQYDDIRVCKCLNRMMSHCPDLPYNEFGWFLIDDIVNKGSMSREQILELVDTNSRYELSPDGEMIRARHGHPIEVEYEEETAAPETLYYSVSPLGLEGVLRTGAISRMDSAKILLSDDPERAPFVGGRHARGTQMLLKVHSGRMQRAGMRFYLSKDGNYLTERVPIRYVERMSDNPVRHVMNISSQSFDRVLDGTRRVELRLYDDKRRMVQLGDSILFSCEDRSVCAKVIGLHRFQSFFDLYASIPKGMLGYRDDEASDPKDMFGIYDRSMMEELGVIGIEFSLMDQM